MSFLGVSSVEQSLLDSSKKGDLKEVVRILRDNKKIKIDAANSLGSTALMEACTKGHLEIVKKLLERGANVHAKRNSGWTPLMLACGEGHAEVAVALIEAGADVNATDNDGGTAILLASLRGHVGVVHVLMERGAEINTANAVDQWTALMMACKNGHLDTVKILIEWGAEVNAADKDGMTSLMFASGEGHLDIVEFLIQHGANIGLVNNDFESAEDVAIKCGKEEVAEILSIYLNPLREASEKGEFKKVQRLLRDKKNWNVDAADADGNTSLMLASRGGHTQIVSALLDRGAEINISNNDGETALMEAAKNGHVDIVHVFIDRGANVDAVDREGGTSLMLASLRGHADVVQLLLEAGADMNASNFDNGRTALMWAAEHGHVHVAELLIDAGADVNMKNSDGESALDIATKCDNTDVVDILYKSLHRLMYACRTGNMEEVERVLEEDDQVDVDTTDDDGRTPLMVACGEGYLNIVKTLVDRGANVNAANHDGGTSLMDASWSGHIDIVKFLIDRGANINAIDNDGGTALMLACKNCHSGVVKRLIERGANVNAKKFDDGWTSLMFTSESGHVDIARILIERGAAVYEVDNDGWTALMEASIEGHSDLVEFLLDQGAKVNAATNDGWTALMFSSLRGHHNTVKVLVERGANVDAVDNDGVTSLMWASKNGHMDTVVALVERDADVTLKNRKGEDAEAIARKVQKYEIAEIISKAAQNFTSRDIRLTQTVSNDRILDRDQNKQISTSPKSTIDKQDLLLDLLEGRIKAYKSLYDPDCYLSNFPFEYLKECTDDFRSTWGQGVYGSSFFAQDKRNKKLKFVVKLSQVPFTSEEELMALAECRHPNILQLFGYSITEEMHNEAYLVLEYVPNHGILSDFLAKEAKRKCLIAYRRVQIMRDIARAINFLHFGGKLNGSSEFKFFHREITSSSICLTADFSVKLLLNFDKLAIERNDSEDAAASNDKASTGTNVSMFGTSGYVCPWYSRGSGKYIPECDIYSVGVIMLELVTGTLQIGQLSDRSFNEDLVDRYFFSNDSSLLKVDADPLAGDGWDGILEILSKLILSLVDFDPWKRPKLKEIVKKLSMILDDMTGTKNSGVALDRSPNRRALNK